MSKMEYMPVDCLQVPKMLFQVEKFKNLSNTAKILYSLFLDRLKFAVLFAFGTRFPGREALLVEAVTQPHRNGEVVQRRTHGCSPERVFGTVDAVVRIFIAVADDVRKPEVITGADIDLEAAYQEGDTAATRKPVAPAAVTGRLVVVIPLPVGHSRSLGTLILVVR